MLGQEGLHRPIQEAQGVGAETMGKGNVNTGMRLCGAVSQGSTT